MAITSSISTGLTTSFWLTPSDITPRRWRSCGRRGAEVTATVITVRLATRGGRRQVSAWVRYHSDAGCLTRFRSGLNRLTGRQLAAVRASLPAPATRPLLVVPSRSLRERR